MREKKKIIWSLVETTQTLTETTSADGTTCGTDPMQDQGEPSETNDNPLVPTTSTDGTTCDTDPMQGQGEPSETIDNPPMITPMPAPTTPQALPTTCVQDESTDVSKTFLHQDSDTEGYSDYEVNLGADNTDTVNAESQITSPIQFTDEPPSTTVEMVTLIVGSVKSDPQTMAEFLSSSANTIPVHVSPKSETGVDVPIPALLSGTTLKPATVKLHKLTNI